MATGALLGGASAQGELDLGSLRVGLWTTTNEARAESGLPPLARDEGLARAAQAHAEENAARGVLDHGSPDPTRDTPLERIGLAGVALVEVGENLALEPRSDVVNLVVQGWMGSPPHRANLLDPDFTHVGFGAASGAGGVYVVQLFGTRTSRRLAATARRERREHASWHLDLRAPVGTVAMVFLDDRPVAEPIFDEPTASVTVDAPAVPVEAILGVRTGARRFVVSDRVTLRPDGRWTAGDQAPPGAASIEHARYDAATVQGVTIEIAYEDEDAPLQLLVDGEHRPEVRAREGVLRTWLPAAEEPREVEVGMLQRNGAIRVVERFTLSAGTAPTLVPGIAVPEGNAP